MTGKKASGVQWADLAYPPAGFEDGNAAPGGKGLTKGNGALLKIAGPAKILGPIKKLDEGGDGKDESDGATAGLVKIDDKKAALRALLLSKFKVLGSSKFLQLNVEDEDPEDTIVLQVDKRWVELPDCAGKTGEIELADDVSNASVATCKNRPAAKKDGKAKEALDAVTPKK